MSDVVRIRAALGVILLLSAPAAARRTPGVGTPVVFATGLVRPVCLAFERGGRLVVGTDTGQLVRFLPDGSRSVLAELGDPPAGITVLHDGRVLATSFGSGRVLAVDPQTGAASILASGVPGANFIVETKRLRILVSASSAGTIVDVTTGTPVVRATGLTFPNGLALGPRRSLYVAQTVTGTVLRLPLAKDGTLGPAKPYAAGVTAVDGIAFDHTGNLLAVGHDMLFIVPRGGGAATALSTDELLEGPSDLAFGTRRGFGRDLYLVNFGDPFVAGTTIVRMPYGRR